MILQECQQLTLEGNPFSLISFHQAATFSKLDISNFHHLSTKSIFSDCDHKLTRYDPD